MDSATPATATAAAAALTGSGRVDLMLQGDIPTGATSVLVQYSGPGAGSTWQTTLPCKSLTAKPDQYVAATGKDDADIYVAGGYSPATGSTPTYNADVNVGVRLQHSGTNSWQIIGALKTDNRAIADPDSFRWRAGWAHESPGALASTVNLGGGMEFDRKGKARNLILSPKVSFVPFAGVLTDPKKPGKLAAAAALEVHGGVETGRNTTTTFRFKNVNYPGTDAIFRGVPGAILYLSFFDPTLLGVPLKKITIVSAYDVRLLTLPEIFLETRNVAGPDPLPQLRSQPRNYLKTGITLKLTDVLGFTITHEHGSLPPAYTFIQNKLTFGIILQLKESRGLRL
jgi:hypothetical protein